MLGRLSVTIPLTLAMALGCSEDTRTFDLVRVVPPAEDPDAPCGAPADGRIIRVNAVGEFSPIDITELIDIDTGQVQLTQFPEAVRALEIEVLGDGGEERTIGRTETFDASQLSDGDQVTVFMAPRRGFCATGPLRNRRTEPLVARAGLGALVVGGFDQDGAPVIAAELYDPRTGRFTEIGDITYEDPVTGMAGASITSLPDGRVVIAGGPADAYVVFDPQTQTASNPALLLNDAPAFHAAVWLDGSRVLLAGGCEVDQVDEDTRRCQPGMANVDIQILDIDSGDVQTLEDNLARPRIGGSAFLEADGRVLLVGGVDIDGVPLTEAERIDPSGARDREIIGGVAGVGAPLAGGGVLAAYGSAAGGAGDAGSVVSPGGTTSTPVGVFHDRDGPTITPLEGGQLLVLGGGPVVGSDPLPEAQLYVPVDGRFSNLEAAPERPRKRHAAVRLDDGTVLVVGGESLSGNALQDSYIFRPDLIGPFTPRLDVTFEGDLADHIVPRDLSRVTRTPAQGNQPARYTIESSGASGGIPSEWGIVAGPVLGEPKLTTTVSADGNTPGIALIIGFRDPANFLYVTLRAGQLAELLNLVAGLPLVQGCEGVIVSEEQIRGGPHTLDLAVSRAQLTVTVDETELLSCELPAPLPPGSVGIGVVGAELDTITVDRLSVSR